MRCGRKISVQGEAEEIAVLPRPRSRQKHGKGSNPYSTRGLDKFQSVHAELSAKREYISEKTGAPEALVRFVYSKNGWIPVVVRPGEGIGKKYDGADPSILVSVEKINGEKDGELRRKDERNGEKDGELRRSDEGNDVNGVSRSISFSGLDERGHSPVTPWSRFLKIMAFGFLGCATWVRRSTVSAATALALAMVLAMGGVMYCMKKFILSGVSYFTTVIRNPRNSETSQIARGVEEITEQKDVYNPSRRSRRPGRRTMSAPSSPPRAYVQPIDLSVSGSPKPKNMDPEHKHHQPKAKKYVRAVSMENRPTRTAGPRSSDSFYRRTRPGIARDASVGATVMIITLLFLVFYGRLCAIFVTSAWWYLLPLLVEQGMRGLNRNNNSRMVDLQSNEYKMNVIMDGLLERKHN